MQFGGWTMPSLNDSMNVISRHPFCFIFFFSPASDMMPAAASELIISNNGFQKRCLPFIRTGCCIFIYFSREPQKLVGKLCMPKAITTSINPPLESWLLLEPFIVEIVLWSLGPSTDGISQDLEGVRAIGHWGLERNHCCNFPEVCTAGTGTANVLLWAVIEQW